MSGIGAPPGSPHVAVCVPVRDEAAHLPQFLDALADQTDRGFLLCILYDGCTDRGDGIVADREPGLPFAIRTAHIDRHPPNAGRARRAAMELGLGNVASDGVILSTDADSIPACNWIQANIDALNKADIVAGRIVRDGLNVSPAQDRVEAYYDDLFRLRRAIDPVSWEAPDPHHYTSGASMAFHVSAYRALGGFEAVPSAEDARMIDAAHRHGLRVRRDGAVEVKTSSRLAGRAANGLADHLRRLGDVSAPTPTMSHPADAARRYAGHAAARAAWGDLAAHLSVLSDTIERDKDDIESIAAGAPNAEAFAMRVVPDAPGGERIVELDEAERGLAILYRELVNA